MEDIPVTLHSLFASLQNISRVRKAGSNSFVGHLHMSKEQVEAKDVCSVDTY